MNEAMNLMVNGAAVRVGAAHDTPLLYVLRNELGLKGTRFGCGGGDCGACMVMVDGGAEKSCQLPVASLAGKQIETVEALLGDGRQGENEPSPVVRTLLELQAGQCGYCLSGIAIAATALLRRRAQPTQAEVVEALDGNLCRCGSQARIIAAVRSAAATGMGQ